MKTGKWDTFYSSYYWNINLDLNNPRNSTPILTGYSKKVGEAEAADKDQLIKRKIVNLYLNGYFNRMKSIDIFQRTSEHIDKKRDPKIIVIYPTYYDFPDLNKELMLKKFAPFLNDFYDRLRKQQSMDGILPLGRKIKSQDDFLDPSKYKFKSPAHLYAHAARCLNNGQAPGAVSHFINVVKLREKWL